MAIDTADILDRLVAFTVKGPNGTTLELASITEFEWDDVVLLPPDTPIVQMRQIAGSDLTLTDDFARQLTSDSMLLVFRHAGATVLPLVVGPPVYLTGDAGSIYTRSEATLVVTSKNPGPYLTVRFAS